MLIIGHRGAAGLQPENTLASLMAGYEAGADMLEFDVRLTSDGVPVLMHDANLLRTNGLRNVVRQSTYEELRSLTAETDKPVASLDEAMAALYGKVMLNIELKQRSCVDDVMRVLRKYCKTKTDWSKIVISSFHARELHAVRQASPHAELWMLHRNNPFLFVAYARRLKLSGVGFHRLYINDFALEIARKSDLLTYVHTVNRLGAVQLLAERGIDGVVTNYPDRFVHVQFDQKSA